MKKGLIKPSYSDTEAYDHGENTNLTFKPLYVHSTQKPLKNEKKPLFKLADNEVRQEVRQNIGHDLYPDMNKVYPHKKAKLIHHNRDLKKRWYVECGVWSVDDNQIVRRRYYCGINRYHTVYERMEAGRIVENHMNDILQQGHVVKSETPKQKALADLTIAEAFDFILEKKALTLRPVSLGQYKSIVGLFAAWLVENKLHTLKIGKLTKGMLMDYLDSRLKNGIFHAAKSYNNTLAILKIMINAIIDRDEKIFASHPARNIKSLKVLTKKHAAFSQDEMTRIKAKIVEKGRDQLLLFIQFMYFTLIRPHELYCLKLHHIDLENNRIFVPKDISKNKRSEYVDIYPPMRQLIDESGIMAYPAEYFIFGADGVPGTKRNFSGIMRRRFDVILKSLNMTHSDREYTLYSFKHTGAINLYLSGLEPIDIQKQCRHASLNQTMEYLRELDLFRKTDHFDKVKSF